MKISIAQTKPFKGDIPANIEKHIQFIELAASLSATCIFFPELSLTGYEPELAKDLAVNLDDERLNCFQQLSNGTQITIGVGLPTKTNTGIRISMLIFQPGIKRQIYSKQLLHSDEEPYFEKGDQQLILTVRNGKIAPAICYESLQPEHSANAYNLGASFYLASVAKSQSGVNKAMTHFPEVARQYAMPVLMTNCIGPCDNFESAGLSSVWKKYGTLAAQLDDKHEGIILFDTEAETVIKQLYL